MTEYMLIESDKQDEFADAISSALKCGWDCQGGVCIWYEPARQIAGCSVLTSDPPIVHYAQALVR